MYINEIDGFNSYNNENPKKNNEIQNKENELLIYNLLLDKVDYENNSETENIHTKINDIQNSIYTLQQDIYFIESNNSEYYKIENTDNSITFSENKNAEEENDYSKYSKIIQDAFYGGFMGFGTDEKSFEALINDETLDGEDWAKIITTFEAETNKSFIDEITKEYGGITENSTRNNIMDNLAAKLISGIENGSSYTLDVTCRELYSALGKDNTILNTTPQAKRFIENILLNSSDKICSMITTKYRELTGCDLAADINSSELSKANKDIIMHKIKLSNEYDIQNAVGDMVISELDINKYPLDVQNKVWTVNLLINGLNAPVKDLTEQNSEDGVVTNAFNFVKALTGLGVSSEDVIESIEQEEQMIKELISALNGDGNLTFEEVYQKWTGVEYDEQKIIEYQQNSNNYIVAYMNLQQAQTLQDTISKADNLQEVYDAFSKFYGEELAQDKMIEYLSENMMNQENGAFYSFGNPIDISFNEKGQLVVVKAENYGIRRSEDEELEKKTTVYDLSETENMIKTMSMFFEDEKSYSEAKENIITAQRTYYNSKKAAIGNADKLEEMVNKYCTSQDGFIDKLAGVTQIAGIGTIVVGGVVTFVNPPVGIAVMSAGKYMALGGMFGDNILQTIDNFTSENGFSKKQLNNLIKETLTEVGYLALGAGINAVASAAQTGSLSALQKAGLSANSAKILSWFVEGGMDMSLSVLSDYAITGNGRLDANAMQVLLGILTGVANAKVNSYKNTRAQELLTEIRNPNDLNNKNLYNGFKEIYGDAISDTKIKDNVILRYDPNEGVSIKYINDDGSTSGSILIDSQQEMYFVGTSGRKFKIDGFKDGKAEFELVDGQKYIIEIGDSGGFTDIMQITISNPENSPIRELYNTSISEISDIFSFDKLTIEQETYARNLYQHICDIGYKDFVDENPEIFKEMFLADIYNQNPLFAEHSYMNLDASHFACIKYAFEQNLDSIVRQAIDERIDSSCSYEIWKYYDDYDSIPEEGVYIESMNQTFPKDQCIEQLKNMKILVEAMDKLTTPEDMLVNRVDSVSVFNNMEIDGRPLSELMTSKNPDDIQMALNYFNGNNNAHLDYDNVLGTTLSSQKYQDKTIGTSGKVYWNIDVPKGTKGLFLEGISDSSIYGEMEFLLNRGSSFIIQNVEYRNGAWFFDVRVEQN